VRGVSVIAATNRPAYLRHLVGQIVRQTYPEIEPILVLHGDHFPPDLVASADARLGESAKVVLVPDSVVFGDALNLGLEQASGAFVTKMDDDDWYGNHHLWDLVLAADYSGAHLTGKAAEFVYLADLDVTIRRFEDGAEQPSTTLAGGAMLMRRDDMNAIGGWRPVARSVDRALLGALAVAGGVTHRTHGFGYLLNRHGIGHTWDADIDYFLQQSEEQVRGLAFGFAGVEDPPPGAQTSLGGDGGAF
jgi:glycosyltransferase involved in cell wall biosynthesis